MDKDLKAKIIEFLLKQGIFVVLFCGLLFYVLDQNSKRETGYQVIIENLSEKFAIVETMQRDVTDIKDYLKGRD